MLEEGSKARKATQVFVLLQEENFPIATSPKEDFTVSLAVSVDFSGLRVFLFICLFHSIIVPNWTWTRFFLLFLDKYDV